MKIANSVESRSATDRSIKTALGRADVNRVKWNQFRRAIAAILAVAWLFALGPVPTAEAAACPCGLFGNAVPASQYGPDGPVKLGVAFYSDVDGYATGMRFYKSVDNVGTHLGELWVDIYGDWALLKSVTFTGETASGWQKASFASPVQVLADQRYMVTYTNPNGYYPNDAGYFSTSRSNGDLHTDATAGRYVYNTTPGFAASGQTNTNYSVDVDFDPFPRGVGLFASLPTAPAVPQSNSYFNHELGTRFSSDVNAKVIGIRYWHNHHWYTPAPVTLWRNDGVALATAVHGDPATRTGWFEVYFDNPVPVAANTEYVASYYLDGMRSGTTANFFDSAYDNEVFHAPADAGVYVASGATAFPTVETATNFWVEPIFAPEFGITSSFGLYVDPTLSLTTAAHGGDCNDVSQTLGSSSGAAAISLGRLSTSSTAVAAQSLRVRTNAVSGYTLFASSSGPLNDGRGHSIADLGGGLTNGSPGAPPVIATNAFGYTTSDSELSSAGDGSDRFTYPSAKWAPMSTIPAEVSFSETGYIDKTVCVAYAATMHPATAAGTYTTNITYNAVPLF